MLSFLVYEDSIVTSSSSSSSRLSKSSPVSASTERVSTWISLFVAPPPATTEHGQKNILKRAQKPSKGMVSGGNVGVVVVSIIIFFFTLFIVE